MTVLTSQEPARVTEAPSFAAGSGLTRIRVLGSWAARTIIVLEIAYVAVFVAGFASIGNTSAPLPDPYLVR